MSVFASAPGVASIDWMPTSFPFITVPDDLAYKNVVSHDSVTVPVKWSKWSGEGATSVEYLLNGQVVLTQTATATSGTQTGSADLVLTKGGKFKLQVRLINDAGSTISSNSVDIIAADTLGSHLSPIVSNVNAAKFPCKMTNKKYQQNSGKVVGAYAVEWSIYRVQGMDYDISHIPGDNITHLFYGFLGIVGANASFKTENAAGFTTMGKIVPGLADFDLFPPDPWAAYQKPIAPQVNADAVKGCYGQLMAFGKTFPNVKKIISIGGWSLSDPFFFMDVAANRAKFVASVEKYLRTWKFWDGIDLDWEFPAVGGANTAIANPVKDKQTYIDLVRELRVMLNRLGTELGKHYEMTIAINVGYDKVAPMDFAEVAKSLDFVNMMSYDFHGAWDFNKLSHHTNVNAPAFRPTDATTQKYNLRKCIDDLVAQGVPKSKLVAGVAMYGRGWKGVTPQVAGTDIFLGRATGYAGSAANDTQRYWLGLGSIMYSEIAETMVGKGTWVYNYDEVAEAPFLTNAADGSLITYDDARSIAAKAKIVNAEGLAGLFAWEIDTDNGDLLNAMNETMGNSVAGVVVPPPVNKAPIANAGANQTVTGSVVVTLDGSASTDPEGKALTFAWTQTAGTPVTLSSATVAKPTFTAPAVAADTSYTFMLTVKDDAGLTSTSSVVVTNKAPVIDGVKPLNVTVSATQNVAANSTVSVSATSDNPNAGTLTFAWSQVSGAAVSLANASTIVASFVAPTLAAAHTIVLQVVVKDGKAPDVTKQVTVNVAANVAPIANAGANQSVTSGDTVTIAGTASDANANILSYVWSQVSGTPVTLVAASSKTVSFTAPTVTANTDLVFKFTVSDGVAAAITSQVVITVKPKATGGTTYPAHVAGKQYNGGDKVSHEGFDWQAKYWTTATPSRTANTDWALLTVGILAWDVGVTYNANDLCSYNGVNYKASYWSKGGNPPPTNAAFVKV